MIEKLIVLAALTFSVIDGDTIKTKKPDVTRIRLWGVDTPELPTPAGKAAKRALKDIVDGQALTCVTRARDRYGRYVAQCYITRGKWASVEKDIGCLMLQTGHAIEKPRYSRGYYERNGCIPPK